jgi:Transposase and inactivated derivatives
MSQYIRKSHNVSVLVYHLVCPAKYRKIVFNKDIDQDLKQICLEIAKRYEIIFLEIGCDQNHVHFLIQSIPMYSPTKIAQIIKSITAREIFKKHPEIKELFWKGEFWTKGYFINTVSQKHSEKAISQYIKEQGTNQSYQLLHKQQLDLFDLN